jgi:hypothetical protein
MQHVTSSRCAGTIADLSRAACAGTIADSSHAACDMLLLCLEGGLNGCLTSCYCPSNWTQHLYDGHVLQIARRSKHYNHTGRGIWHMPYDETEHDMFRLEYFSENPSTSLTFMTACRKLCKQTQLRQRVPLQVGHHSVH